LTLESCIFSGNQARESNGGAIDGAGTITVKGCTFYNNTARNGGGGAINMSGGTLNLAGNLFFGNTTGTTPTASVVNWSGSGTRSITSQGYNITNMAGGTGSGQSGFAANTTVGGDVMFAGNSPNLGISGDPFNTTSFIPDTSGRLHTHVPAPVSTNNNWATTNMPPTDFYGRIRTWPGAPGAVRQP